jgi:hypothetical protein
MDAETDQAQSPEDVSLKRDEFERWLTGWSGFGRALGVRHVVRPATGRRLLSVTARDATDAAREVQVEPQGDTALLRFDSEPAGPLPLSLAHAVQNTAFLTRLWK